MDKDRIEGPVKEGMGKLQEGWGHATGQADEEMKGREKQAEGKLQEGWGEAKDSARTAVRDATDPSRDGESDDD